MPDGTESLMALASKMEALQAVVIAGNSLAVATGMKGTPAQTANTEEAAIKAMSLSEKSQYAAWKSGERLAVWDKATCRRPTASWNGGRKSLDMWTLALQMMYEDETLVVEHTVWHVTVHPWIVPCITAYGKVLRARSGLVDAGQALTPEEMAEYQTAKKILSTAAERVQKIMSVINGYNQTITEASQAIQARAKVYERKVRPAAKMKEGPVNKQLIAKGQQRVTGPKNLGDISRGTREERATAAALQRRGALRQRKERVRSARGQSPQGEGAGSYQPQSPTLAPGSIEAIPEEGDEDLDLIGGGSMEL